MLLPDDYKLLEKLQLQGIPIGSLPFMKAVQDQRDRVEQEYQDIRPRWNRKKLELPEWRPTFSVSDTLIYTSNIIGWLKDVSYEEILDHPNITGMDTSDLNLEFKEPIIMVDDIMIVTEIKFYIKIPKEIKQLLKDIGNITTSVSSYESIHCAVPKERS